MGTSLPPLRYIAWSVAVAIGVFIIGAAIFRRTERRFADVI